MGGGDISPFILNCGVRWGEWSDLGISHFITPDSVTGTLWIRVCVGPGPSLVIWYIFLPSWTSNHGSSDVQTVE